MLKFVKQEDLMPGFDIDFDLKEEPKVEETADKEHKWLTDRKSVV